MSKNNETHSPSNPERPCGDSAEIARHMKAIAVELGESSKHGKSAQERIAEMCALPRPMLSGGDEDLKLIADHVAKVLHHEGRAGEALDALKRQADRIAEAPALGGAELDEAVRQSVAAMIKAGDLPVEGAWGDSSDFKTNDRVRLVERTLYINGTGISLLKLRQTILAEILLRRALEKPGSYLTTDEIIRQIEERFAREWRMPMKKDVYDIMYTLREALGAHRSLIQTSPRKGGGYRISTPPWNIFRLPDWPPLPEAPGEAGREGANPTSTATEVSPIYQAALRQVP